MTSLVAKVSQYYLQVFAILTGSLTLFTSGIQFAWCSPYIPLISSEDFPVDVTFEEASYFTVIPPISFLIFTPFLPKLADILGRKYVLLLAAPLQFSAWICIYFSNSLTTFYISRFLTGVADAVCWSAGPTYIGEISEPHIRGTWGMSLFVLMYLGQTITVVLACFLDFYTTTIVLSVFPVIFFLTYIFMPESPYYYVLKGKTADAYDSLSKLRGNTDVGKELQHLTNSVQQNISQTGTYRELFCVNCNRKALIIALGTRMANQFSGIGAFTVYAQYMFHKAGQEISENVSAIALVGCLCIFTTISSFFQDKFGRRLLMILSCSGCTFFLVLETLYFYLDQYMQIDLSQFQWFPLACMILYLFFFSGGLALVPNILLSELFATSIKSKAIFVTNAVFTIWLILVPKIFQVLTDNFGLVVPFLFFSVCTFFSSLFSFYCIPETKGKTLDEIQEALRK